MKNLFSERSVTRVALPAAGALALLLLALFAWEHFRLSAIQDRWSETSAQLVHSRSREISTAFVRFQEEAVLATKRTAMTLGSEEMPGPGEWDPGKTFRLLGEADTPDLSLELYDTGGTVLAWKGAGGPPVGRESLRDEQVTFILDGPIYSYLTAGVPIVRGGRVAGYLVGKRLFNVSHPVNNRFVSNRVLAVSFASTIDPGGDAGVKLLVRKPASGGTPPGIAPANGLTIGGGTEPRDPRSLVVSLKNIAGRDVAYAILPPPELQLYLEETEAVFGRWRAATAMALLCALLWTGWIVLRGATPGGWSIGYLVAGLWLIRYALVWTNIPGSFFESDLFTPALFASAFGYGAARSLGDMSISAALLAVTMLVLFARVASPLSAPSGQRKGGGVPGEVSHRTRFLAGAGVVILIGLLGPLSRALYAVIRSAVFDTRIELNDPKIVFPGPEMGFLLLGIFLLILSLVLAGTIFLFLSKSLLTRIVRPSSVTVTWAVLAGLTLASSLLFDILHTNPLGSAWERMGLLCGILLLAFIADRRRGRAAPGGTAGSVLMMALAAIAVLIPLLDEKVHEHDKTMVETVARDLARPEDSWMRYLINEALDDMSGEYAAGVLAARDYSEHEKLAFGSWAGSVLGREGNNCSVTYVDLEGSVVSYFHVGVAPHWSREVHMDEMPRSTRLVGKEVRTLRGRLTTWYKGYAPVFTADSVFVGGVWVGISPLGPENILGQEFDLLTTSRKYEHRSRARDIMLSEFTDGRLSYSSNEDIPHGTKITDVIPGGSVPPDGTWLEETISGKPYESFYLPRSDRSVVGIGIQSLDPAWHFYSYSRYILFFSSVLLCAGVIIAAVRYTRPGRRSVSFRAKLITAFVVVSVIPVVLLAWYNRTSLLRDADESNQAFLRSETEVVLNEVQARMGMTVPYELSLLDDESLEEVAARIKTEFYVFRNTGVQASSRPELFAAELIDRRITAGAFLNLYLGGKNYYTDRQTIGTIAYLVGYRPVRAQSGEVIGAIAVPTLFRQSEVEENIAREDVVLSGIYILVLCVSLLIGTLLADQIARPMRRLIAAARRVATGDLGVKLETQRTDEIGELESAFNSMTADLRGVQDQMRRVERELAWKEMARQVAHEIKNPLTPMRLSVQHLVSAYRDRAAEFGTLLRTVSATILEQIDSLSRIASEFSAFARFPERRLEVVDLHEVIDEAVALHRQEMVDFRTTFTGHRITISADREELRRVFINIFRNSIQASPAGVTITIDTVLAGGKAAITIADNGPGVAEDIRPRLFEPNFSTKTDGMGIGLTIVKKTVEDIGGSISLESAPGLGTTIHMTIPLTGTGPAGDDRA